MCTLVMANEKWTLTLLYDGSTQCRLWLYSVHVVGTNESRINFVTIVVNLVVDNSLEPIRLGFNI